METATATLQPAAGFAPEPAAVAAAGTPVDRLIACPACDALQTAPEEGRAVCYRCGTVLQHGTADRLEMALPFALASVPLFLAANFVPLLAMEGSGNHGHATLLGAARALWQGGLPALGVLVALTTVVLPAFVIAANAYLLIGLRRGVVPPGAAALFHALEAVRPWTQLEILLLGLVVAFGRLASVFIVKPGMGLVCLVLGLVLERAVAFTFDGRRFWRRVDALRARPEARS